MNDLDSRLSEWNPVRAGDVKGDAASAEAAWLLQHVLNQPIISPARRRSSRLRWPGRAWIAVAAAVAIAIALAGPWPITQHTGTTQKPDMRLVDFSTQGGYVTALITDPYAAAGQLSAVFQAHGLNIHVQTVPVSPSLIGTFIYSDAPSVRTMWKPRCSVTGCPVGLVIPASFAGQADVAVGRPARHGETYESMADVFAPGEALHCSGLLGSPVSAAAPILKKLGLRASWWSLNDPNWPLGQSKSGPGIAQRREHIPAGYILEGDPVSATKVDLDTLPALPANHQFRELMSQWNRGCH